MTPKELKKGCTEAVRDCRDIINQIKKLDSAGILKLEIDNPKPSVLMWLKQRFDVEEVAKNSYLVGWESRGLEWMEEAMEEATKRAERLNKNINWQ